MNGKTIEQLTLNGWPALQTLFVNGWLARFADGYTKRSNSVNALHMDDEAELPDTIEHCERLYAAAGQDAIFKITPFAPAGLDGVLHSRGYEVLEPSSVRVLRDLNGLQPPPRSDVVIEERLSDRWLELIGLFNGMSERSVQITKRLLAGSVGVKGYFILCSRSVPVACGYVALERGCAGLYDIVTDPACRGSGFGERLVAAMLHWARAKGADSSYLQVVRSNAAANGLYGKFGYEELYGYWYRRKGLSALDGTAAGPAPDNK